MPDTEEWRRGEAVTASGGAAVSLSRGPAPAGAWSRVVAYVETTKFRSVVLLTFGALVGGAAGLAGVGPAAAARAAAVGRLEWALLAVALGCMGANAITGYVDRRMDAVMERTKHRPLPTGRLHPGESFVFGVVLVLAAGAIALPTTNLWSLLWLAFGVVDSTLVYNGLTKPRTAWNVILGSPAGGAPVMVGAAAVTGRALGLVPFLVAALVVAWTPVHIWSLAIRHVEDYKRAGVPMLPVVLGVPGAARCVAGASLALCVVTGALVAAARFDAVAAVAALALQVPVVAGSLAVLRSPTPARAQLLFKLTSPYLAAVFALTVWQSLAR